MSSDKSVLPKIYPNSLPGISITSNIATIKDYVESAYEEKDKALENIGQYFREQSQILDKINRMVQINTSKTSVGVTNLERDDNNNIVANKSVITHTHTADNHSTPKNEEKINNKTDLKKEISKEPEAEDCEEFEDGPEI